MSLGEGAVQRSEAAVRGRQLASIEQCSETVTGYIPGAPDRALVTDPLVAEALTALLDGTRMHQRWAGIATRVRLAHQDILRSFLDTGTPPSIDLFDPKTLEDLAQRDLVHVRNGYITVAYPFSADPTDFRVNVGSQHLHAVCAVDALGVAAMAGGSARVSCLCPVCENPTDLDIAPDGLTISYTTSPDAHVWAGVKAVAGCAMDTQCRTMRMFCSAEHLAVWRKEQGPGEHGFDLLLEQAVQLGAAIFRPFVQSGQRGTQT